MSIGVTNDREIATWKAEVERIRNGIFPGEENPQSHVETPEQEWDCIEPATPEEVFIQ